MSSLTRVRSRLGALTGALVVLTPLSQLGFVPVAAVLGERLGIDAASIGLAIGLYALSAAVGTLVLGPLFDLVPARRILPWAVLANLAVALAFIWVPNLAVLLIGRVLAGFANSALGLTASVMVADAFRHSPADRDRAYSGMQTFTSTGAISGLALGGLCAGLGLPWLYFVVVAAYAVLILCLSPLIVRRMRGFEYSRSDADTGTGSDIDGVGLHTVASMRSDLVGLLRDIARLIRAPQTILLLLSTACASWVLQGGHYSLSLLMNEEQPSVFVRTALTVMIPIGVLLGALVNQWSLSRMTSSGVYGRAFLFLPLVCGVLAASLLSDLMVVWAGGLVCVGIVCGMLGPLQPTMIVGWYPGVRGSASAAIIVANSIGAALGPIAIGLIAMVWVLPAAVAASAAIAAIGAILAALLGRRASGRVPSATSAASIGSH